jgi:hypothetical protein
MKKNTPSFDSLDFTKVSKGPAVEAAPPTVTEEQKPEVKAPVKKNLEGAWINGISVTEITSSEFKNWLSRFLPGTGVEETPDEAFSSNNAKEMIIQRLGTTMSTAFRFPRMQVNKNNKNYEN